ncbi:polysaccharide biosynthesis protein GumE [Marinobacter fonticola]|uniref:polysaccharide biosynthesis protein GumE n=1 Tax=Marinobacter fonticola TaxID=2603215 RepID=UPI001930FE4E|nr:polysaccharide biosynthesis protein GumE [Marinobacter fonticola]
MIQNATHDARQLRLVLLVVGAAVTYQAVLCALHTVGFPMSRAIIGAAEFLILAASFPLLFPRVLPGVMILAAFSGGMLCLLALLRGGLDIKAFRDLLIPFCFYWAGRNVGEPAIADKALKLILIVVLFFAFFELLALDVYTQVFNIFSYYVSTGGLEEITEYERDSRLQMNGIRPEGIGRTLLPWLLDSHRVSSVFLEPVSLGNFATIVAAWGLAKERSQVREGLFFIGAAVVLIVLADSRFALLSVGFLMVARVLFNGWASYLPFLLPLALLGLLVGIGLFGHNIHGDDYVGRLASSGRSLIEFDVPLLLGYGHNGGFPDQGYAYSLSKFGLVLVMVLWLAFWLIPAPDDQARRFRCYAGIYIALILCVSGSSLFAMKTAGLLWFLFGVVMKQPAGAEKLKQKSRTMHAAHRNARLPAVPVP